MAHERGHGHGCADLVRARLCATRVVEALGLRAPRTSYAGRHCRPPHRAPAACGGNAPAVFGHAHAKHSRQRFWVLLRWKEDGATLIFGHAPHFQHELDEEAKAAGVLYEAGKKGGKSGH